MRGSVAEADVSIYMCDPWALVRIQLLCFINWISSSAVRGVKHDTANSNSGKCSKPGENASFSLN